MKTLTIFSSPTCLPCQQLKNTLKQWQDEGLEFITEYYDISDESAASLAATMRVRSVPTTFVYDKDKEFLDTYIGFNQAIKSGIKNHIEVE